MPIKHQSKCFRTDKKGIKLFNYCDLEFSIEENAKIETEARQKFKVVKKEKINKGSWSFYRLFVSLENLK